jgi:cytidylate kinase
MAGESTVLTMSAQKRSPVITIDGPSGSGKGTVARSVAAALDFHFLDSGSLYRAVALASLNRRLQADDVKSLALLAGTVPVQFESSSGGDARVLLGGQDVTRELREEEVGDRASRVAVHPEVRDALLDRQRRWRQPPGLVADGRDMGTVVFANANLKIFLTASAEIRAHRRYKQLIEKGMSANIDGLLEDIRERDRRDTERAVAALRPAPDAVTIDSSTMAIDQVVTKVLDLSKNRL